MSATSAGEFAVLFDRSNWPQHRPWLIVVVIVLMASVAWSVAAGLDEVQWPGGSSVPGFTFGIAGGLIIVFEFLLWLRRKVRTWRVGSAQAWLRAHIWLGLLCLPLLILHSGLRLGGTLTTAVMTLLVLVIASGIWGLVLQNLLPRRRVDDLPAETVYSQENSLVAQLLAEADRLVSAACGVQAADQGPSTASRGIVGASRFVAVRTPAVPIAESEALSVFYREQILPFLHNGAARGSPLARADRATILFHGIRTQLPVAAHEILDALESFCNQRRQWDRQARLHFWLHNWLWVHYPLSVALLVLMAVHVFVALKYW